MSSQKIQRFLNEQITLEELQITASGQYKDNEHIQERLEQAQNDYAGCISIIESIEQNSFTEQEFEMVENFVSEVEERKVTFSELQSLQSLKYMKKFVQNIGVAMNIKDSKKQNIEDLSQLIQQKMTEDSFKVTKKLEKVFSSQQQELPLKDLGLQTIYILYNDTVKKIQSEQQQEQQEQQQVEEQEKQQQEEEEIQQQQQSAQKPLKSARKSQKSAKKSKKVQFQEQKEAVEQEQQIDEELQLEQQIENQEQQQQIDEENEQSLPLPTPEKQQQQQNLLENNNNEAEDGEIIEEQQNIQEIQEQQQQLSQQSENKIDIEEQQQQPDEQEKLELPEDINELPSINIKNFKIFEEMLSEKLQTLKKNQKKKRQTYEKQIQIIQLATQLVETLENTEEKFSKNKLNSLLKKIEDLKINQNWVQVLSIKDISQSLDLAQQKIDEVHTLISKNYEFNPELPLYQNLLNSGKPEFDQFYEQFSDLKSETLKFEFEEEEQKKIDEIQTAFNKASVAKEAIQNFQREVNLHQMKSNEWQLVENMIMDIIEKIIACPLQQTKYDRQFLYKAWLFSCTCFNKKFKTGTISDWEQLQQCAQQYPQEADRTFVKIIEEQIEYQKKVDEFMETLAEKKIEEIKEFVMNSPENKLISCIEIIKMQGMLNSMDEKIKENGEKLNERLSVIEWRDLLKIFSDGIPFKYQQVNQIEKILENAEEFEGNLAALKKEKTKKKIVEKLEEYLTHNFKHPEYEKLVKKHKVQESEFIVAKRNLFYHQFQYQEFVDFEKEFISKFSEVEGIKSLETTLLISKIKTLKSTRFPVIKFEELKQFTESINIDEYKEGEIEELKEKVEFLKNTIKTIEHHFELEKCINQQDKQKMEVELDSNLKYININYVDFSEEILKLKEEKQRVIEEENKKKQEALKSVLKLSDLDDKPYDPLGGGNISTKKTSERASQYKAIFITRLSKHLQDNIHFNMNMESSISQAKRIVNKVYQHYNNSDRIQPVGERINIFFKQIQRFPRISAKVKTENFSLKMILKYKEKTEQQLKEKEIGNNTQKQQQQNQRRQQYQQQKSLSLSEVDPIKQEKEFLERKKLKTSVSKQSVIKFVKKSSVSAKKTNDISPYEKYMDQIDSVIEEKRSIKKASTRKFPILTELESSLENQNRSLSLESLDETTVAEKFGDFCSQNTQINEIYRGKLENDDSKLQGVGFLSKNRAIQLSSLPMKGNNNDSIHVKDSVKLSKFREYFDVMCKDIKKNRNVICFGWVESSMGNHTEALKKWAQKLRNLEKVAVYQWGNECKFYLLHKDMLTARWKRDFNLPSDLGKIEYGFKYDFESSLLWICVYKKYKAITTPKLVPKALPQKTQYMRQLGTSNYQKDNNNMENENIDNNLDYEDTFQHQQNQFYKENQRNAFQKKPYHHNNNYNKFNRNNNYNNNFNHKRSVGKFSAMKSAQKYNNNNYDNNNRSNFKKSVNKFSVNKSVGKFDNNNNNNNNTFYKNTYPRVSPQENYLTNKYSVSKDFNNNKNSENNQSQQWNNNNNFRARSYSTKKFQNRQNNYNNNNNYNNTSNVPKQSTQKFSKQPENNNVSGFFNGMKNKLDMQNKFKRQQIIQHEQQSKFQNKQQQKMQNQFQQMFQQQQQQIALLTKSLETIQGQQQQYSVNKQFQQQQQQQQQSRKMNRNQYYDLNQSDYQSNLYDSFEASDCEEDGYYEDTNNSMMMQQQQQQYLQQIQQQQEEQEQKQALLKIQQMKQQQQQQTENAFLRQTTSQPKQQRKLSMQQGGNQYQQQQQNSNFTLGDVTSKYNNNMMMNQTNFYQGFDKENQDEIPAYLNQKMNNQNGRKSTFKYSTKSTNKDYLQQAQDQRYTFQN